MADPKVQRVTMVDTQLRPADVTKFPVLDAMLSVPREKFVPDIARETAYMDGPIALGAGRSMLEPRSLGKILDQIDLQPDEMVLDIGCGTGYSSAVAAHLALAVVAVESDEFLARDAEAILSAEGVDNVVVVEGQLAEGAAQHGPYDAILVQGAVETIPNALVAQLKEGGRIAAIFREGALGTCKIGRKHGDTIDWRFAFNASAEILPGFARIPEFEL